MQTPPTFPIVHFLGHQLKTSQSDSVFDVITSIQNAKKSISALEPMKITDRIEILLKTSQLLQDNLNIWKDLIAAEEGLMPETVQDKIFDPIFRILNSLKETIDIGQPTYPVGVVAIIVSGQQSLLSIFERLVPAFLANNATIIKIPSQRQALMPLFFDLFQHWPESSVQVLSGAGASVGQLLASHPGVHAVSAVCNLSTVDHLLKAALPTRKKLQIATATKNSMLILNDADLERATDDIIKGLFLGSGRYPWNISRLFILDSQKDSILEMLLKKFQKIKYAEKINDLRALESYKQVLFKIPEEQGRILAIKTENITSNVTPALVIDLPNCSVYQQDPVPGPLLIMNTVKYTHEMAKWVNTGYLGHSAFIYGPVDKAENLSRKLEVGNIFFNKMSDENVKIKVGLKQSHYGLIDYDWNGCFFTLQKNIYK